VVTYTSYQTDQSRLDHAYVNFELVPPLLSKQVFCLDDFSDLETKSAVDTFKTFCLQCTIKNEYENLSEAGQQLLKSIVLFLMEKIIEKYNCKTIKDEVIINALQLMHEGINKHQTIADIAKTFYLTTEGFIRKFKRHTGETPYSYLKKLKVRTAQNMRMTNATLELIAEKCGYSDSSALLHAIGKTK
jgi:YesN/AraC family two-component response regulator